jgi:hypothetical protein
VVTARLRLRAFRAGDLDAYAAIAGEPEAMRYLVTGQIANRVGLVDDAGLHRLPAVARSGAPGAPHEEIVRRVES